jgi:hypothetical protein
VPSFRLRVRAVFDLFPFVAIVFVDAKLSLRDNSLKVSRANLLEKLPMLRNVLRVKQTQSLCIYGQTRPVRTASLPATGGGMIATRKDTENARNAAKA